MILIFQAPSYKNKIVFRVNLKSTLFNVKFRLWLKVDKLTLFRRWNMIIFSTLIERFWFFKHDDMRTKLFLESTQNQRCFNVEIYRRINVDKSTLNQRGYYVDRRRDVISTYINVESTLSVCWVRLWAYNIKLAYIVSAVFIVKLKHKAHLFLVFLELTLSLYLFAVYLIISRIDFRIIETKNISKKYHLVSYMILVKRPC